MIKVEQWDFQPTLGPVGVLCVLIGRVAGTGIPDQVSRLSYSDLPGELTHSIPTPEKFVKTPLNLSHDFNSLSNFHLAQAFQFLVS